MVDSKSVVNVMFIGDQHFRVDNIIEVELFITKVTELAIEKKPDFIVLAGDLLDTHERIHTTPLNKAYEFVNNMRKIALTYVLVGNHDLCNNQQFLTDNHWMNGMKEWYNTIIVDKVIYKDKFIFVPYVAPGRFEEALNTLKEVNWKDINNCRCIFAHQEIFGCKMGGIISIEGDKWDELYPNVISGHIHTNHRPQCNIYYPGSSMQHSFGDGTKNIIAFLEFKCEHGLEYKTDEYDLDLPRKKIIYIDVENIDTYDIEKNNIKKDRIKLSVSGNYDQFKALKKTQKYKNIIKNGIKVVFKPKKIELDIQDENLNGIENMSFSIILEDIINKEDDSYLLKTYELLINKE